MEGSNDSLSVMTPSMGSSPAVLLTPGRTRNIAQDMEALRLSRQDNPYLQQVMASRESLIESHAEECGSDDTILMSQEFGSAGLDFVEDDPLTLKEVHEHMIRSPPPTSCWPHGGRAPSQEPRALVPLGVAALARAGRGRQAPLAARREPPAQRAGQAAHAARAVRAGRGGRAPGAAPGPLSRPSAGAARRPAAPGPRTESSIALGRMLVGSEKLLEHYPSHFTTCFII